LIGSAAISPRAVLGLSSALPDGSSPRSILPNSYISSAPQSRRASGTLSADNEIFAAFLEPTNLIALKESTCDFIKTLVFSLVLSNTQSLPSYDFLFRIGALTARSRKTNSGSSSSSGAPDPFFSYPVDTRLLPQMFVDRIILDTKIVAAGNAWLEGAFVNNGSLASLITSVGATTVRKDSAATGEVSSNNNKESHTTPFMWVMKALCTCCCDAPSKTVVVEELLNLLCMSPRFLTSSTFEKALLLKAKFKDEIYTEEVLNQLPVWLHDGVCKAIRLAACFSLPTSPPESIEAVSDDSNSNARTLQQNILPYEGSDISSGYRTLISATVRVGEGVGCGLLRPHQLNFFLKQVNMPISSRTEIEGILRTQTSRPRIGLALPLAPVSIPPSLSSDEKVGEGDATVNPATPTADSNSDTNVALVTQDIERVLEPVVLASGGSEVLVTDLFSESSFASIFFDSKCWKGGFVLNSTPLQN